MKNFENFSSSKEQKEKFIELFDANNNLIRLKQLDSHRYEIVLENQDGVSYKLKKDKIKDLENYQILQKDKNANITLLHYKTANDLVVLIHNIVEASSLHSLEKFLKTVVVNK